MKYYKLPTNPARLCGSMGKKQADDMDFWTVAEFQQFIKATEDDITAKTIFNLFFYSGIYFSNNLLKYTPIVSNPKNLLMGKKDALP